MSTVPKPTCRGCPHDLYFSRSSPAKQFGVTMHFGEHYCTGSKRARRFRNSDPITQAPNWCPKRKFPYTLRIYGFKNAEAWLLHEELCHALNREFSPEGHRYILERELTTELTAQAFQTRCDLESEVGLLGTTVPLHGVIEIDDGLQQVFFYKTTEGYRWEPVFDVKRARANGSRREEDFT